MAIPLCRTAKLHLAGAVCALLLPISVQAAPAQTSGYVAIPHDAADRTVVMNGNELSIEELVAVARHGAKVELTPAARKRSADAYGLLLQAAAEGVSVYWFNRGTGAQRETIIFSGDPTTPENDAIIRARQLASFGRSGFAHGPELADEGLVRAIMAIRVNTMSYEAASPGLTQMLIDLLNKGITPVVRRRGTVGEADIATMSNIAAAMIGRGEVHYHGQRMPAAQALAKAGLKPLEPVGADDSALFSTNAYALAHASLLVSDARELLEWADISTAMALLGMNSSITPLSSAAQSNRPFLWLNHDAARVLGILRGSYLLDEDPQRVIQDPESLRASTQRVGAAWQSWAALRDTVLLAINSSDHNPAVRPGLRPEDSWELSSPQMMRYHVTGGKLSNGQSGYIVSTANWDPYPLANDVEAFTIALGNMSVVFAQRIERFGNPFFTIVKPDQVMSPDQLRALPATSPFVPADLWIEITGLLTPVTPQGQAIVGTVEDLQAETRLKLERARTAVDLSRELLAHDMITSSNWMKIRSAQNPKRSFGGTAAHVLAEISRIVPQAAGSISGDSDAEVLAEFLRTRAAASFYVGPTMPPARLPAPKGP